MNSDVYQISLQKVGSFQEMNNLCRNADEDIPMEFSSHVYKILVKRPSYYYLECVNGQEATKIPCILTQGRFSSEIFMVTATNLFNNPENWQQVIKIFTKKAVGKLFIEKYNDGELNIQGDNVTRLKPTGFISDLEKMDLSNFSKNNKRNIKKAIKIGMTTTIDNSPSSLKQFNRISNTSNIRRDKKGVKNYSYNYLKNARLYTKSSHGKVFHAIINGEKVGSILMVFYDKCATYAYGGTTENGMENGAASFLLSEAMKYYKKMGYKYFNFDVSSTEGLTRFKAGFGTTIYNMQRTYINLNLPLHAKILNFIRWIRMFI